MPAGVISRICLEVGIAGKTEAVKTLDGPKKNSKPSVSIVKAVIKLIKTTKKLAHNSESETEGSVEEQRREMEDRVAGATQTY